MAGNEFNPLFQSIADELSSTPATSSPGFAPLFSDVDRRDIDLQKAANRNQANVENALISKLGLDSESVPGQYVNLVASGVSGLARTAGNVATLVPDTLANMAQATVPNETIDAYYRVQQGQALPGDEFLINQTAPGDDGVPQTYAERMQGIDGLRQTSKTIADAADISSIVDTRRRDRLSDDIARETKPGVDQLKKGADQFSDGDYLDAAGNLIAGAGRTAFNALTTGYQDPGAVAEYAIENVPQLAAALYNPALGVTTNAGYASNEYREGITDFQEQNDGAQPSAEERLKMGLFAASAGLAEQVGDLASIKGIKSAAKAASGAGKGSKAGFIAGQAGAQGKEALTEGYQTFAEDQAHLRDSSVEGIVEAATIGALVGGTFHGAASVVGSAKKAGQDTVSNIEQGRSVEEAFTAAVNSGDVSSLADPTSTTYDPVRAVEALTEVARNGDEASVQNAVRQSDVIQQDLTKQVSEVEARMDEGSPSTIQQYRDVLPRMEAAGASQADIQEVKAAIAAGEAYTPAQRKADAAELQRLNGQLGQVRQAAERLQVDTSPEPAVVESVATQAEAGDTQAVDRLLTLTMTNPDAVDTQVADALAVSANLTEGQRTAMRAFSEAQVAANALKGAAGVRSDIATGGDGFKGIPQYRNAIRMALADGNIEAARSQVDGIASFAASRVSKAEAIAAAYEQVKGSDRKVNLVRDENGVWAPTELTGSDLKAAGGLEVSAKSFKLRDGVQLEADVLTKTANAFQALVDAAPAPVVAENLQSPAAETVQEAPEQQTKEAAPKAEQTVESEPAAKAETGELTAVREKSGEVVTAENYTSQNLVGALFDQQSGKDTDATQRPLVAVKDFASKVLAGEVNPLDHLDQKGELSGPQRTALTRFFNFARFSAPKVREQFKLKESRAKRPDFFYTDMAQFLVNQDGQIDENLATAVSYGMFTWANENATQLRNTPESINAILLRDLDTEVNGAAYEALSTIGTREAAVAAQLGGRIVQALGLRPNQQGTDAELAKLEASVGARAVAAMVSTGLAERVQLSDVKLQELMASGVKGDPKLNHNFVRVKGELVDGRMTAAPIVAKIREGNVGSQSVLSKLFSVEAAGVEPSYTPVKFDQKFAKRTQQDVPKVLAETLEKEGAKPHVVRQDMFQVWGNLSTQALYEIAGVVSTTDTPTHVENLASRQAKNDGLMQQVDNFNAFVTNMVNDPSTNGLEQELFFGRSVWKPQRVGLSANVINPQTSKVHRHMLAMSTWEAKVDLNDGASMDNFRLRVLESFGVKTEATNTPIVLAGYDAKVNTPEIQAGVDALAEVLRGEANDTVANEAAILAAVKAGGEAFHSLDALVALATMKNAIADGATSFTSKMMGEVDGVTNGPALSLVMLGAKGFDEMNAAGFFEQGSEFTQFNDYHAVDGNLDMYEGNISKTLSRLQGRSVQLLEALQVITGKLQTPEGDVTSKGRKIIKQPLTALMFGSNPKTAVDGMAEGFIESIYSKMEDVAGARSNADMQVVLEAVNKLIGKKGLELNTGMGYEAAMNTRLTQVQKDAIKKSFYDMLGKPTEDALADNYATFIERRNVVNQTAQLAFDMYNAAREAVTDVVLGESTSTARNSKGEAIRTLTKEQEAQVNERLGGMAPVLQTALSLESKQLSAGMHMAKTKKVLDSSQPFTSEVAFGEPVNTIDPNGKVVQYGSTRVSGQRVEQVDPGVMPFITSIHSTDSAIASSVYGNMDALNVHDALGVDLSNVAKVGQELNKATFNQMLNYSAPSEMAAMMDRTLAGMARLVQDADLAPRIQSKLAAILDARGEKKRGNITQQLEAIRNVATQADTGKLNMLASMQAVGQYATDGGSYIVTDADRAKATAKLAEVGNFNEGSAAVAEQLDTLAKLPPLELKPAKIKPLSKESVTTVAPSVSLNVVDRVARTAEGQLAQDLDTVRESMLTANRPLQSALGELPADRAADVVEAVNNNTRKNSVWGTIGTPLVESDANLVQLLETNELTAHNLADALIAYNTDEFTKRVLQMVKRATSANLPVNYVTSETGPEGAFGEGVDKARGWYAQRPGSAAVFVKSPEFAESGITKEMLTHELVHGALAGLVDRNTGRNNDIGLAIADLEALRAKAADLIANNGVMSAQFRNATSNVHELLAWGLTNEAFQRDVLAKVDMPTRGNRILDGLKSFIGSLTKMLFRGENSVKNNTGLAMLVATSTGLFREAGKLREKRESQTLKYEDAMDHVNAMTAGQVFDGLATLPGTKSSAAHATYLRGLLESTVEPLYGPYGAFKEQAKANMALTPQDVFLKAVNTGNLPFASQSLNNAFIVNQQEAFVLESVDAALQHAMLNKNTVFVRSGLEKLYKNARAQLKAANFHAGDWNTATQAEKDIAQAKWDQLFKPQQNAGGQRYLTNFAALGMASEEVRAVLDFGTADTTRPLKSLSWGQKITELFTRVMAKLGSLATKVTPGMQANAALETLVDQLVDIEAKHKVKMAERKVSGIDMLEASLGAAGNTLRARADALGKSNFFRQSNIPLIKLAGTALSTVAGDRVEGVLNHITKVRDSSMKSQHGLVMGILTEMRGAHDGIAAATAMFKQAKSMEKERKDTIEGTIEQINAGFKDNGKNLSKTDKSALTKTFLRTNAAAIADAIGTTGLKDLMEDPAAMAKYRADLESQVTAAAGFDASYMISQTKDLAHHKAVGGSTSPNLMLNTRNIAMMYGTAKQGTPALAKQVVPMLEQLLGVYALEYTGTADKAAALQVFRTEANRADGHNGVDLLLKMHSGLQKRSTEALFQGQEALQQSGYVPEIHDNKIEVLLVAPADIDAHKRAGFVEGTKIQQDPIKNFGDQRVLMTRRGSGQNALLTGAMSFTGMHSKGSTPVTEAKNLLQGQQVTSAAVKQQIAQAKAPAIAALFNRGLSYDPRKVQAGHTAPTLAPDGRIADYRHMMTEHNRDVLLDRDSSMDQVMGVLAGQIVDKVNTAVQNTDVVRALHDQYVSDYKNRPSSYLMVGPDAKDPQLAELWRLLPTETKKEIRKSWKSDNMMIPADQINLIMGYRKYSLTNAFSALPADNNMFEKTLVTIAGGIFGEKAELRIGQAEDIMQELVKEMKDILVVKNITTLVGNIVSNMTLLAWEGVPLKKAAAAHAIAIKGALDYRRDARRLMQLNSVLEIGYVPQGTQAIDAEIVELKDRLERNPIKPLIEAGLMPTIVEDVEADDSTYSYKSRLQQKTEKFTSKVPAWMRTVGKQVYMTHDTATYKFLSQTTQLSDLVARYAMFDHLTTRTKDPLSFADALKQAEESFVNYDLPSHKKLQYMNDMGVVMFTKYYLRIQKVIARLVRERPARGIMLAAANHYVSGLQSVMDSTWLNRLGNNPLQDGALGYLGSLKELPAIKFL